MKQSLKHNAFNRLIPYLGEKEIHASRSDWTAKRPQHSSKQIGGS